MASLKSSEIIANLGVGFDDKSLKKITQGFLEMEKYYQNIINKMTKKESQQAQKTKKTLGKTLNEYQKMFKEIQKGSENVDFSSMATGIASVVEIASKAIKMLNEGNERTKNLLDSAVGLEKLAKNLNIDVESIQLLQQAGKPLGLEDSDIAGFISSMNSARLALKQGESTQATATLQQLGVNRGEDTATIINKALSSLSKQDVAMRERLLSSLGISDDLNRAFTQLTSKTEAEWKTMEKNNKAMTTTRETAKEAFDTDIAIDRRSKESDKEYLAQSLPTYEISTLSNIKERNARYKILLEISKGVAELKKTIVDNVVPWIQKAPELINKGIQGIKDTYQKIIDSIQGMINTISILKNWVGEKLGLSRRT